MPWRHWLLQAVLCLVLAASIGLAALLRQHRLQRPDVGLLPPQAIGRIIVSPPATWTSRHTPEGVSFQEPPRHGLPGRRLDVWLARPPRFVSPLEYLLRSDNWVPSDLSGGRANAAAEIGPINVAGWPGVMLTQARSARLGSALPSGYWTQTLACAIAPSGEAILVRLEADGVADPSDADLVRRLADSLAVTSWPEPMHGGEMVLPDGLRLLPPGRLARAAAEDRFRAARMMIAADDGGWVGVELVPCIVLPADRPDLLRILMLARDPACRLDDPQQIDEQTWLCQRREGPFPVSAYLRLGPGGLALLAEFRWNSFGSAGLDQQQIDALWSELAGALEFPEESGVPGLLQAGARAVPHLPADPADLLDPDRPEQRWQWYDELAPRSSWTSIHYRTEPESIAGGHETERCPPLGSGGREMGYWRLARDWSEYSYTIARAGPPWVLSQETHMERRNLRTTVSDATSILAQASGEVTGPYIPGGILPLAMGRFPFEPMLLRTDALITPSASALAAPLIIRLEPAFDLPKGFADEAEPMRCWSVRINGASESSRWYFDPHDQLHSIAFAGGVHFHRVEAEIEEEDR